MVKYKDCRRCRQRNGRIVQTIERYSQLRGNRGKHLLFLNEVAPFLLT